MSSVLTDPALIAARDAGASSNDLSLIAQLKAKAAEFEAYRLDLERQGPAVNRMNDPKLLREYGDLLVRADEIKRKITAATQAIDSAIRKVRDWVGLDGLRTLSSLGVVWFLPAAVIVAAVSVIGFWIADYAKFSKKFGEQQRIAGELEARGMSPAEAQRTAAEAVAATVPGLLGELGKPLVFGAALVAGFFLWQHFKGRA